MLQNAVKAWTRVMANAEAVYIKLIKKTKHLSIFHGIGVDWQSCTAASTACKEPQVMATHRATKRVPGHPPSAQDVQNSR